MSDEMSKPEALLREAALAVHKAEITLGLAQAKRDGILRDTSGLISRRRAAELTDLTPGRIQQIIDKVQRGK